MLGKKSDGTGIADGVAPEAKLAFCDIGTKRGFLRLPPNDLLLETGRVDGMETIAHIHSASWGLSSTTTTIRRDNLMTSYMIGVRVISVLVF